jgi:hypothetical protein
MILAGLKAPAADGKLVARIRRIFAANRQKR